MVLIKHNLFLLRVKIKYYLTGYKKYVRIVHHYKTLQIDTLLNICLPLLRTAFVIGALILVEITFLIQPHIKKINHNKFGSILGMVLLILFV